MFYSDGWTSVLRIYISGCINISMVRVHTRVIGQLQARSDMSLTKFLPYTLYRAFSIVGIVPGVIMTVICAASVQYTSLILWRLCLKHPEIRDGCDVALVIFGGSRFAYHFTSVMFILCNVFIQGQSHNHIQYLDACFIPNLASAIHCLIGAELLNTLSGSSACTVAFSAITAAVCFVFSLPRTLDQLSWFGIFSAIMMTIAGLLVVVFSATQDQPVGFTGEAPIVTLWPLSGTTYVSGKLGFTYFT